MSPAILFIFMTLRISFFQGFSIPPEGRPNLRMRKLPAWGAVGSSRRIQVSICDSRETNGEFVVDRICRRSKSRVEVSQKFGGLGMSENPFALQNGHQARCKRLIRLERRL